MKYPCFNSRSAAFTLTETLVVISLLSIFMDYSLTNGLDAFMRSRSREDRLTLASAIREARAQSQNSLCMGTCLADPAHGVLITPEKITIFEGSSYATRNPAFDIPIPFQGTERISATSTTEIIFNPKTANVSSAASIGMEAADHHGVILQVNQQGGIQTTNI